jgi:HlyD family secretion protein
MKTISFIAIFAFLVTSCGNKDNVADASGSFEAEETIISAGASGTIMQVSIEEGQLLDSGQKIGYIDSIQLYLKKKQLEAQITSTLSGRPDISSQIAALQVQLKTAEREQQRISNLVKADAATQKQLDDANAQIELIKKQIEAQQSALGITSGSITQQTAPLEVQIAQINDQLEKCRIINPMKGTVLAKYAEANEMATMGKPLYKVADISSLTLRAYLTGNQLALVKLNQKIKVVVDDAKGSTREYTGVVIWISDKAEFTPKTILTKEERANLVYAVKIKVPNDGLLKLGMYGEIKF